MKKNLFYSFITAISICVVLLISPSIQAQNQCSHAHHLNGSCAVAPSPYPFEITQPDGSKFIAKMKGSSAVHYLETEDGFVVLKNRNGEYVYSIEKGNGDLVPSNILVHDPEGRTFEEVTFLNTIQPHLRYSGATLVQKMADFQNQYTTQTENVNGAFPCSGVNKAMLLLIDFPDKPFINTVAEFDDYCNQPGYNVNGQSGSFRDYFLDISYGNLEVNTQVFGWYTAQNNHAYYGHNTNEARELVREAVDAAEAAGVDFSQFDNDGNGVVDQILVIHSGEGEEASGNADDIWSHKSSLGSTWKVTYDGVELNPYIIQPERLWSNMANIGVLCHEFGHALGLPDLYDYDGSSSGLGKWCLMSGGTWNNSGKTPSHMSAWCKQELGWLTPTTLTGTGSISNLDFIDNASVGYRMNTPDPTEYFLITNRQKVGWDLHLPGTGLAIWHIDDDIPYPVNNNEWQPLVSLRQADGLQNLQNDQGSDNGDLYPGSTNNNVFDQNSTPDSDNYNGNASGVNVTNISESGTTLSFNYGAPAYPSTVIRGPYLNSGTPTSTVIKWRTSNSTDSKVWYGSSHTNLNQTETISGNRTDHEVTISGLSANTTYYYAIGDTGGQMEGANVEHYFTTAPTTGTSQPITAWILGDCGTNNSNQEAVRDAYYNYIGGNHTDMILMLGDNAYQSGWDSEYQGAIFDMYETKLKNSMVWSCPGNHDYYGNGGLNADYYDIFTFPTQGEAGGLASNTEKYYSYDYGNIHIVSLDSYDEDRSPGSPMLTWLENDLAATTQEWIVVIWHHPPYTKGSHDSDTEGRLIDMRENVVPICEDYGVDLILGGHSHSYERSYLINGHYGNSNSFDPNIHGIDNGDGRLDGNGAYQQNGSEEGTVYIVTGSAGKKSSMGGTHEAMYYSVSQLGSTIMEVNGDQMDVKFLNEFGVIEDYLTLTQNGSPSVNWTNPTNGQVFPNLNPINFAATASDNDGNVTQVEFFVDGVSVGIDYSAPYSMNWTPTGFANYTLKAEATDNEGKTNVNQITITVQNGSSVNISSQVTSSSDDAEEEVSNGSMGLSSSDLELAQESGVTSQEVGMRFNNINIPQGSTITNAYIQFTNDESESSSMNLTIYGQDANNPGTFTSANSNISNRTKTSASVSWSPVPWTIIGEAGVNQQTPDLSSIVQEIVNRSGWSSNNSMVMIITGTGDRTAESFDGMPSGAPELYITYTLGGGNNCAPYVDNDNDGHCSDVDCNDNNAAVYPGATEICDGIDNNCDGQIDEGLLNTYYADSDGDGFGDANVSTQDCSAPSGYVSDDTDCDDTNGNVYPGAPEICDFIDNDCDGQIDENGLNTYYADTDGDGFGDPNSSVQDCTPPSGYISDNTDCDDTNGNIYPNATEICDGIDNDCDGLVDEGTCTYCTPIHSGSENELITNVTVGTINNSTGGWNTNTTGYSDYTNISTQVDIGTSYSITVSPNYSFSDSKLGIWADWNNDFVFQSNEEIASLNGTGPWTTSFTPPANAVIGTTRLRIRLQYGSGYTPDPCIHSGYNSGETEDYSLDVVNCNPSTYFADTDSDGYGDPNNSILACSAPSGYVSDNTDCDDTDGSIYPTAPCDDENPLTNNDEYDANCVCAGTYNPNNTVISSTINSSSDDAEEDISDGSISLTSTDLELVDEGGNDPQEIGLRFKNITIPNGATIVNAYIQFTVDETDSGTTNLDIFGEASGNASTFINTAYNITNRAKTSASINWNPSVWNTVGAAGAAQQATNITSVIQEIVNQGGWNSGNSLAIIITGYGERTAESYDGVAASAPKLFIEYNPACQTDADDDGYCASIDCDDNDATIHPGATEICDGIDNNCDGQIDEGLLNTYYADTDNDGFGDPNNSIQSCSLPSGYVTDNSDCDDAHANVHPNATEVCDGVDNNCDGQIDEGLLNTYYADTDSDGYGDPNNSTTACSTPSGYVSDNTDCNDSNGSMYPTAPCDDGNPLTNNDQYDANCVCAGTYNPNNTVISSTINSSSDDAEEDISDGSMDLTSSDLELVDEHGNDPQEVGLRFNNINVPNGATIVNAYIQFTVDEVDSGTTNLDIFGEAHDNAPTFSSTAYDITNRTKTNAWVSWDPTAWNTVGDAGVAQQTTNISAVVQEIVNRSGWNSGNSLAIIITGIGERTADSYDGSGSNEPQLFIEYSNCTVADNHDFESNWGIWNDGGSDARRNINDAAFANSGSFCVRLRDNTSTSVMTTDNLNLSTYSEITVDFSYQVESFENTEDFWLQISTDGGATFTTEEDWVRTIDFQNGERHNPSVTINGPFTSTTKVRFRCDASGNSDWVYIDDVVISGCGSSGSSIIIDGNDDEIFEDTNEIELETVEKENGEIHVFPNPVSTELTVEYQTFEEGQTYIDLYDLRGQKVLAQPIEVKEGLNVIQLSVSQLPEGMYLLSIMESKARLTKQIVISR